MITLDQVMGLSEGDLLHHPRNCCVYTEVFNEIDQSGDGWALINTTGGLYMVGNPEGDSQSWEMRGDDLYLDSAEAVVVARSDGEQWRSKRIYDLRESIKTLQDELSHHEHSTLEIEWPYGIYGECR